MDAYLNAGNQGRPMGRPTLEWIKALGLTGVRVGIHNGIPTPDLKPVIKEIADVGMKADFIVGGWDWWNSSQDRDDPAPEPGLIAHDARRVARLSKEMSLPASIEIGNEPDLTASYKKKNVNRYIDTVAFVFDQVQTVNKDIPVYACSVSNIDEHNRKYAERVFGTVHPYIRFAFHPYRTTRVPWDGFSGFAGPEDAAQWAKSLGRPFAITECGWHTAGQDESYGLFGLKKRTITFNDQDVRKFADYELNLWQHHGADFYTWYQINDGPDASYYEDRFGIRYMDGNPKPVAEAFSKFGEA